MVQEIFCLQTYSHTKTWAKRHLTPLAFWLRTIIIHVHLKFVFLVVFVSLWSVLYFLAAADWTTSAVIAIFDPGNVAALLRLAFCKLGDVPSPVWNKKRAALDLLHCSRGQHFTSVWSPPPLTNAAVLSVEFILLGLFQTHHNVCECFELKHAWIC